MKNTLAVRLDASPSQLVALRETVERINKACAFIARVAFEHQCASKFRLQKLVYRDVRAQFGLSAQMTIRAIAKVAGACRRDLRICPAFSAHGAVAYDVRILSRTGEVVSILTLSGRERIRLRTGDYHRERLVHARGEVDLVVTAQSATLVFTLEVAEAEPQPVEDFLGVDLGIVNLAVDSDGEVATGASVERVRRRVHDLRRRLQRAGTKSAKRHLVRLRKREAHFRRDVNHRIAKRLVSRAKDTNRGIALEDLRGIRARTTVRRADRARHSGWAFAQLQNYVRYKAKVAGVEVRTVDPRNSSRECAACGFVSKTNRPDRDTFRCVRCGASGGADHNAARVIALRATRQLALDAVVRSVPCKPLKQGEIRGSTNSDVGNYNFVIVPVRFRPSRYESDAFSPR